MRKGREGGREEGRKEGQRKEKKEERKKEMETMLCLPPGDSHYFFVNVCSLCVFPVHYFNGVILSVAHNGLVSSLKTTARDLSMSVNSL